MNKNYILGIAIIACLTLIVTSVDALRITVKRIVFEGAKRAEVITLINNSDLEETYRIGWRHFVMTEDKSLRAVPDDNLPPEVKPVTDMIRYAPRRFSVPPKSSQQIRVMLRTPPDLPDGEYRSHFWIRPEADVERIRANAQKSKDSLGQTKGVYMEMLTGVTMPIIVRKGNLGAEVTISNFDASQSPGFVNVKYSLLRTGEKSVYGNIDYICNRGTGSEYNLRAVRGIAIYPEINRRNFERKFEKGSENPSCSTLTITYRDSPDIMKGSGPIMAEATVNVR